MKKLGIIPLVIALAATSASANPFKDSIIAQLSAQGFSEIRVSRTFLGRTRVVATSSELRREIIFNPATGEILRDYWRDKVPTIRTVNRGNEDDDNPVRGTNTARIVDPVVEDNENTDVAAPDVDVADTATPGGAEDPSVATTSETEDTSLAREAGTDPAGETPSEVGGSTSAGGSDGSGSDDGTSDGSEKDTGGGDNEAPSGDGS
jgi:hypothetical protein